jgi:N-acetylglutamate synthase-like GNAT family acetyltransferase
MANRCFKNITKPQFTAALAINTMNIEPIQFTEEVEALLVNEGLPASDLSASVNTKLFGIKLDHKLVGLVGLEQEKNIGLLRSLVVSSNIRNNGYGKQLIHYVEAWALENSVAELYLLTTTAASYFIKIGFKTISRDKAPPFIVNTHQFSNLCPSSAEFMCKKLSLTRP